MRFRLSLAAALLLAAPVLSLGPLASAAAPVEWAPPERATIHPGVQTSPGGPPCTANFVFTDRTGAVYLGQAAHCTAILGEPSGRGCATESLPLGTPVSLGASGVSGSLAYSSWLAMQKTGDADDVTCHSNDFALVRVPAAALPMLNPSVPVFGGPVALAGSGPAAGEPVYGYGSSALRGGLGTPQPGLSLGAEPPGWYHLVYLVPPGVPGDSGSGLLDAQGRAFGVLISLDTVPPASNGATDLGKALAYARQHSGIPGLALVPGTEPFRGAPTSGSIRAGS